MLLIFGEVKKIIMANMFDYGPLLLILENIAGSQKISETQQKKSLENNQVPSSTNLSY